MTEPATETAKAERIAKRMAAAGLCSRREAERWIEDGRVQVNGETIDSPALTVTDADEIVVDGLPLAEKVPVRLWLYHKPAGLVTTHSDPEGRPTVFENLPEGLPARVISVGRLDLNSEGLLLLTTSGELSRHLEHPDSGWKRRYRVRLRGFPDETALRQLKKGITIDDITYRGISVEKEEQQSSGSNQWALVTLTEGKNREIRRVFEHFGHPVSRLIRIAYGPFQLGKIPAGEAKEVTSAVIRNAVGKDWAKTYL